MEIKEIKSVYFVGVGGIGMSAIARYFLKQGKVVGGYDKTPSALTKQLEKEGISVHYEDNLDLVPAECKDKDTTLVVYTPAIPKEHSELCFFQQNGFDVEKRAQVLGRLTRSHKGLCFAGTHGKTTTSTMCAHIMHQSHLDCNAFLGGISKNYGTNYIIAAPHPQPLSPGRERGDKLVSSKENNNPQNISKAPLPLREGRGGAEFVVIEADEFDRSFHWLRPWMSVITSTDPDHLDIYGTKEAYLESFAHYSELVQPGGALIVHKGLEVKLRPQESVSVYEYSRDEGDFHAENIKIENGNITFDFISPIENVCGVELGQPIPINIVNGIAAMAMAQLNGCTADELREGMRTYGGVDRRFDFRIRNERHVLLSDYAHHPKEILASAQSLRELYKDRHITAIFQPHLYTRTRDFYKEFAEALSILDRVVLTEIYPARELPIPGVTSEIIYNEIAAGVEKLIVKKDKVADYLHSEHTDVVVVLGAGDLDNQMDVFEKIINELA